ncbi:uncharacterized protein LOC114749369 isoform X2 [Neltuma alba]|uniref:uncharacterized protein LOC114749369 isoform X2 n=1 Tax=Neltuma alba TaxID=207710 RepID=UPI0010A2CACF|nr:uncharacterized protein LOC114749369 isoform X2 [Prosopis alba]
MIDLFLTEPCWDEDVDSGDSMKLRISLLKELESTIWSLIMSGSRSEARLWLCNTIAGMTSITCHHQCELFMDLLRSQKQGLASQLLHMMFEKKPQMGGSILAKRSHVLENFFEGNPKRVLQWFVNYSSGSGLELGKGAKALAQFAFKNRDICWEELEWKGKHGQSPAVVATKPHYFLDLDIQQTVENFLENVPEFWSSNEFAESVKDGDIFFIDRQFFVQYFIDLMYKDDARDIWEVIDEFLTEQPFSSLCHRLLIALEEQDLFNFLKLLRRFLYPVMESKHVNGLSNLFEIVLVKCEIPGSIDQMLLLNAIITQGRQILRLLRDEDAQNSQERIKEIVSRISAIPSNSNSLIPFFKNACKMSTSEVIKCLGLQCWVLYCRMSHECHTPESWESVFLNNHIGFRSSNKYALLGDDGSSDEHLYSNDCTASIVDKSRKKQKARKKRRRNRDLDDDYGDGLLNFDSTSEKLDLLSNSGRWLLSTDGYLATWTNIYLTTFIYIACQSG